MSSRLVSLLKEKYKTPQDAIRALGINLANDSKEKTMKTHTKPALSRHAAFTQGALTVYLGPKLAKDAKIDLFPILKGTTAKNFKVVRPTLVLDVKKALVGKLAKDASLDDLNMLLDKLEPSKEAMDEEELPKPMDAKDDMDEMSFDDKKEADLRAMLEGKLDEEEIDRVVELACGAEEAPAAEATDEFPPKDKGKDEPKPGEEKDDKMKGMVSKPAMDAALKKAREDTVAEVRHQFADRTEAQNLVRPLIGEVTFAMDTADKIFRAALDHAGVEHDGITDQKALRRMAEMAVKQATDSERAARRPVKVANDAGGKLAEFNKKHGIANATMRHV